MNDFLSPEHFMGEALKEARKALEYEEIPVGAVVVWNDRIIARGYNQTEQLCDATAHAELIALTSAFDTLGSKYLHDCTLYVTLEPCVMCAGALFWAQISEVVMGAPDPKRGFLRFGRQLLHPKTKISEGIRALEAETLLKNFFNNLRVK